MMNTTRSCGCKGYRSCLICEVKFGIRAQEAGENLIKSFDKIATFCFECQAAFPDEGRPHECGHRPEDRLPFPGVKLIQNFISKEEEDRLLRGLDALPWDVSQSGRRKQNFGPRANFKKRKVKAGEKFEGFPACTRFVQDRFSDLECLKDYRTVEQCSIEYREETGSCIEPHIDDCWVWGERIVQLNLLSDSYLTMTPYRGPNNKYNLQDVDHYPRILDDAGNVVFNPFDDQGNNYQRQPYLFKDPLMLPDIAVRIPLPRRSLLVLHGEPRYQWEHFILRKDVSGRRIIIAYREFTPPYLPGGQDEDAGKKVLEKAAKFW